MDHPLKGCRTSDPSAGAPGYAPAHTPAAFPDVRRAATPSRHTLPTRTYIGMDLFMINS